MNCEVTDTGFVLERNAFGRDTVRGLDIAFVNSERLRRRRTTPGTKLDPTFEVISLNKTADTHLKVTQLLSGHKPDMASRDPRG